MFQFGDGSGSLADLKQGQAQQMAGARVRGRLIDREPPLLQRILPAFLTQGLHAQPQALLQQGIGTQAITYCFKRIFCLSQQPVNLKLYGNAPAPYQGQAIVSKDFFKLFGCCK